VLHPYLDSVDHVVKWVETKSRTRGVNVHDDGWWPKVGRSDWRLWLLSFEGDSSGAMP
jgi:hypothetical protein